MSSSPAPVSQGELLGQVADAVARRRIRDQPGDDLVVRTLQDGGVREPRQGLLRDILADAAVAHDLPRQPHQARVGPVEHLLEPVVQGSSCRRWY